MNARQLVAALAALACSGAAGAGEILCRGVPPGDYAYAVAGRLERTRDREAMRQVYEEEFSPQFKAAYSFPEFYAGLTGVQQRLQIGPGVSRDLPSRTLSRPEVTGNWSGAAAGKAMPIASDRAGPGDQVAVEFTTSSGVGKLRQRVQVTCTDQGWKASGIWYLPSAAK